MKNFSKDVLFTLAMKMSYKDILNLCKSNREINTKLCNNEYLWIAKLENEFPGATELMNNNNFNSLIPRYKYKLLSNLTNLKKKLKLNEDIYQLFNSEELDLYKKGIQEIPKEIGNLINLKVLALPDNQIREIPVEIANLINLEVVYLGGNQIELIPKEIGYLKKLRYLAMEKNNIKEIPEEIGNLENLTYLNLTNNEIETVPNYLPKKIRDITMIASLY
jgi:Leucine-rich repeat (LRR) protein